MATKSPTLLVVGLLVLLSALALYLWSVLAESSVLRLESAQAREESEQLRAAKNALQKQTGELTLSLNNKHHYISEIDAKLLKTSGDLEAKVAELNQCLAEKNTANENVEKQKNELKAKEDQWKSLEEQKKKVEASLAEFKKLCDNVGENEMLKKLCS